jgi:cytochrome c2/cytochrome b561
MRNSSYAPGYSRTSVILGWTIMVVASAMTLLTTRLPRTEKMSVLREDLRSWHYLIGFTLLFLLAWRLVRWFRETPVAPAPGMTAAGHRWTRTLTLTVYVMLLVSPFIGFLQANFEGLVVRLGPFVELPAALAPNHGGWRFFGYFHSAFGFAALLLNTAAVLTAAYLWLRRGVGLLRAYAPGFGAQALVGFLNSVYALNSFRAPEPGYRALAIVLALAGVVWAIGAWLARRRARHGDGAAVFASDARAASRPSLLAATASALGITALFGFGLYGPYMLFRVTPLATGVVVEGPAGATSHEQVTMQVRVTPPTDYERQVQAETYKWCRFCHTVEKGGKHLVGPNLYAIFGQRAGTAPNFHYSEALAEAGRKGLVWNDETIAQYIAGPDRFIPGTSMIISSGPVQPEAARAAVVNILKRETMPPEARIEVAAP